MLNFDNMFMVDNTGSRNTYAIVAIIVIVFFMIIGWNLPSKRRVTFFGGLILIFATIVVVLPNNNCRDVYVAVENPQFEISDFRSSDGGNVKKINDKYYFNRIISVSNYKSTEELNDRIESSYKIYLEEVNADKNKKQYQKAIQKLEEKGKNINGIKQG